MVDFHALFEHAPNAYMVLDRDLRFVTANDAYLKATGTVLADIVGRHVFEAFPNDPGDPANAPVRLLRESFARVLATKKVDLVALIPFRVQSSVQLWSATHTPILDAAGSVQYILQHTVDVTEVEELRLAASGPASGASLLERARRVQEDNRKLGVEQSRLRRMFEQAPGFVALLHGPEHVFEVANPAYLQVIGHREVVGKRVVDALPEVVEQGFVTLLDRVLATGEPFIGRAIPIQLQRTKDGPLEQAVLDFVYQPIFDDQGKAIGIFVQGHDITAQKLRETELSAALDRVAAAEQTNRFLAEAIPQQVWTARPDGTLDGVNQRVSDYFGADADAIIGAGWQAFIHPDDLETCVQRWVRSLGSGADYEVHFRLRRADGEYRWHLGRAVAQFEGSTIIKWFGTNTDIHAERIANDELIERSRFEQQLIGIVSHDLRNPLSAIMTGAQLLLRRGDVDDRALRVIARIESSAERMTRMIRDLLDFTQVRLGGGLNMERRAANLPTLAADVVFDLRTVHPERSIELHAPAAPDGYWDPDRVTQVLTNLLTNALTYSPPGSAVTVRTRDEGEVAVLEIHNLGAPIPEGRLPYVFQPMQRAGHTVDKSVRSVGLGLYIVDHIVQAHHGTIGVTSDAERGTTFTVRLPKTG